MFFYYLKIISWIFKVLGNVIYRGEISMEIIQTNHQKNISTKPTRFEQLRELNKRNGLESYDKLANEFTNLEKGFVGEAYFENFLLENGEPHWLVLKNVWLVYNGGFECDFLVFTHAGGYTFEIKNYLGKYEYKENQWFRNGTPNSHNPLSQVQKAKTNLQNIFKQLPNSPHIKGVLVFIGEFNRVHLHESIPSIKIIQRNELMDLFWEMKQEERNFLGYSPDKERLLKELAIYETVNPYQNQPIPNEVFSQLKTGICCSRCGSFELEKNKGFIICRCGIHEPRVHAILRIICEFGILFPEQNFKTSELTNFFGGDFSKSTLIRILNKHYQRVNSGRNTEYINKVIRTENICEEFELTRNIFLKI